MELEWQRTRDTLNFSESDLLREAAWVILCAGFSENAVRRCFSFLSLCFCDWESAREICQNSSLCKATAWTKFRNEKKIDAILEAAFRRSVVREPIQTLRTLPYVGDITSYHLAKNLGFHVAKPDRHLVRLAHHLEFDSAQELCMKVASATGDPISVVDLVFWRFIERGHMTGILGPA
jgi:hypothetical protein